MAFLNFMKKREKLLSDIDLDIPPEPPRMMGEEISREEPIDEELMPKGNIRSKFPEAEEEELPELPPLPEIEEEGLPPLPAEKELGELPELPPLLEEGYGVSEDAELLPPLEIKKERKGFFSFLKPKKADKELELPTLEEETPEMPPLPEVRWGEEGIELPELPQLSEEKEAPTLPWEKEIPIPRIESLRPAKKPIAEKEVKEIEKPPKERRFITIDAFKQIQGNINDSRAILKDADHSFVKLEEAKGSRDKEYSGLHNSLKDIQTKIMFVDRVLFKEV